MFDFLMQFINYIGEHYGLLPAYAIVISVAGFVASTLKNLFFTLSIMAGVYIAMFKAFNLKTQMFPFDIGYLLPLQQMPYKMNVSQDMQNTLAAILFVYAIGLVIYLFKRLIIRKAI